MKFRMFHTITAVTLAAFASAGTVYAADEQKAPQVAAPAYGYVTPWAPYGFHPWAPPYAYGPVYGFAPVYAYGPAYGHGPWGVNEGWFQAQEEAMLEHDQAIREAMEQQMQTELEWLDRQRQARHAPMQGYRHWREAESDAWHRWVDPYGAWRDDMDEWRRAQWDAWADARMRHPDRYRPHRRRAPLAEQQVAQEQSATEAK